MAFECAACGADFECALHRRFDGRRQAPLAEQRRVQAAGQGAQLRQPSGVEPDGSGDVDAVAAGQAGEQELPGAEAAPVE